MPEVALSEVTLHYEIEGAGPPVMLIAGTASDSASWGPLVEPLRQHFTLIRPDNRSTGRSRPLQAALSVEIWAADALALATHLGLGPVAAVGHSLGGMIAMEMAARAPDQVSRLALLASAPLHLERNHALFDLILSLRAEGLPQDLWLRAFYPWLFHPKFFAVPGQMETALAMSLNYPHAQPAEAMAAQVAALRAYDGSATPPKVRCPSLALLAEADILIPQEHARAALADLPDLQVQTIAKAGHSIHWDAPEAVLAALIPFLQGASHDT